MEPIKEQIDNLPDELKEHFQQPNKGRVGRRYTCDLHKRMAYGLVEEDKEIDATINSTINDTVNSQESTITDLDNSQDESYRKLTEEERNARAVEKVKAALRRDREDEDGLGRFDRRTEEMPVFEPKVIVNDDLESDVDDTIQEEKMEEDEAKTPKAGGSQGRMGEGCSTPVNAKNHTFAPLRGLDVSEVLTAAETSVQQQQRNVHVVDINFPVINADAPSTSGTQENGTFVVKKTTRQNDSYSDVFQNFRPLKQIAQEAQSQTFTVKEKSSLAPERTFLVPEKPATRQPMKKVSLEQREKRFTDTIANAEKPPNMAENSPMAANFNRPAKKIRELHLTPNNRKSIFNRSESMEKSIVMENIDNQHHSINSNDDSMVDPLTDPPAAPETPKRTPDHRRLSRNTHMKTPTRHDHSTIVEVPEELEESEVDTPVAEKSFSKHTVASLARRRVVPKNTPILDSSGANNTALETTTDSPHLNIEPSLMFCQRMARSGPRPRMPDAKTLVTNRTRMFDVSTDNESFASQRNANITRQRELRAVPEPQPTQSNDSIHTAISSNTTRRSEASSSNDDVDADMVMDDIISDTDRMSLDGEMPEVPEVPSLPATPIRQRRNLLSDSMISVNTPHRNDRIPVGNEEVVEMDTDDTIAGGDVNNDDSIRSEDSENEEILIVRNVAKQRPKEVYLCPRKLIKTSQEDIENEMQQDKRIVRRSTRTRMLPVRQWLGERAIYELSPSGNRRLKGTNEVVIKNPALIRAGRSDNFAILDAEKGGRKPKNNRLQELAAARRRGRRLNLEDED